MEVEWGRKWIQFRCTEFMEHSKCELDAGEKGSKLTKKSHPKIKIWESDVIQSVKVGDVSHGISTENKSKCQSSRPTTAVGDKE